MREQLGIGHLFDYMRDGMIVADAATGRIVMANPAAEAIFGYPAGEPVGLLIEDLIPEQLKEAHRVGLARYAATGRGPYIDAGTVLELPALCKDGQQLTVELTLSPISGAGDRRLVVATLRDVTERKRMEEQLRQAQLLLEAELRRRNEALEEQLLNEERFRLLVDNVRDYAIFMLDPEGRVSSWNAGAERIKGYRADEIVGQHFSVFYPAEDREWDKAGHELRAAADEGRFEDEGWRVRKDGSLFWANVVVTALRDGDGMLVGFARITRDLTENRRAEEERVLLAREQVARAAAEAAEHRWSLLAEVSAALASSIELGKVLDGITNLVVPRLADWCVILLGSDDSGLLIAANVHCNPSKQAVSADPDRGGTLLITESDDVLPTVIRTRQSVLLSDMPNGLRQVAELNGQSTLARASQPCCCLYLPLVARDSVLGVMVLGITESDRRYAAEDVALAEDLVARCALAIDNAQLFDATVRALHARDEFLDVAAHELKTPLTSLRLSAQLFRPGTERALDPGVIQQLSARIDEQAAKLARLVDQLLDVNRIEAGRLALSRETMDLAELVRAAVDAFQPGGPARNVRVNAPAQLPAEIDPFRCEQVLVNLLDNAAKFSPQDAPIEVDLSTSATGFARLAVRDYGEGISEEDRSRIFERFAGVDTRSHTAGMGLGLYISRQIVELHGGDLAVELPADGGTRFVVTLPVAASGVPGEDERKGNPGPTSAAAVKSDI